MYFLKCKRFLYLNKIIVFMKGYRFFMKENSFSTWKNLFLRVKVYKYADNTQ